ncbi:MAG: hypothetical protein M3O62_14110 [Pseudomonadota bacterium]|nr:hypothetical protein [Pseudomonadota bacterium]
MNGLKLIAAAAAFSLVASSALAQTDSVDEAPSAAAMTVDLLIVRPLGLVASVLGIGLFVVQLPFAVLSGDMPSDPANKLVVAPLAYTFTRPLGEME